MESMRRTFDQGDGPLPRWAGLVFLLFGGILLTAACTQNFRKSRRVRSDAEARIIQIMTFMGGGVAAAIGLHLFLIGRGVTIDRTKKTVQVWRSVGPFRFGAPRPLSDFDRVRVERRTQAGVRFRILLAGRGSPVEFDYVYLDEELARKRAREIGGAAGLPVEGAPAPALSAVQLNRALAIFQAFGPERSIPVEERWSRELPEMPTSAHAALRARCEGIEAAAGELAGQVIGRELGQDAGKAELGRRFPELDAERLSHIWSQALYFESRA